MISIEEKKINEQISQDTLTSNSIDEQTFYNGCFIRVIKQS
jgi:hypothetical protein